MALTDIGTVDGLPRSAKYRIFAADELDKARLNNQFFLSGASPAYPPEGFDETVVVFLEAVYMAVLGTFTIEGAKGVISGAVPAPFSQDHSPIRLDGGVKLNGTIVAAKGFWVKVG